jgi:hypothetical protein
MGRIEKTVFISYRRTDESWGQAIFQDLTQHGYDVFIDYDGIASGNFETAILENIKARAHFLVLLTPTALDRCGDPKDWMRREIEVALDSQRNIVPLMLAGFEFGKPAIAGQLTGKLAALQKYNGLEIPKAKFFSSEMERLRSRYLNVPVDAVLHSASVSAQQVATEQKGKAAKRAEEERRSREMEAKRLAEQQSDTAVGDVTARGAKHDDPQEVARTGRKAAEEHAATPKTENEERRERPSVPSEQSKAAATSVPWRIIAGSVIILGVIAVLAVLPSHSPVAPQPAPAVTSLPAPADRPQGDLPVTPQPDLPVTPPGESMFNLGVRYQNGDGVAQDYGKAREWYEKAAAKGNSDAMNNLGWIYQNGLGVAYDYGKAREWYEKAAAKGNLDAMKALGMLYDVGMGVAKDYGKARQWYEKAAAKDDCTAKRWLEFNPSAANRARGPITTCD